MKDQKQILAKLMSLDNVNADKYLAKFADELFEKIKATTNNEEVLKYLDILDEFIYKVPKQSIAIVDYVIGQSFKPQVFPEMGNMRGKDHEDVVVKAISLLEHLRYIEPREVLRIILTLTNDDNKAITAKALEVVKKTAKYDFNLLTKSKIGYGIQRLILDLMRGWNKDERLKNFDFIEAASHEILGSSIEGTSMSDEKTMVLHSGVVSPTPFLKEMRKDAIDFIFEFYKQIPSGPEKLKLIRVLEEAGHASSHIAYGDDVAEMIATDVEYLAKIYRQIIFDASGKMIAEPAIVSEIEKRLYWVNKSEKHSSDETRKLREDILKDPFYSLFRLLVNDQHTFKEDDESWEESDQKRRDGVAAMTASISKETLGEWIHNLNRISDQQLLTEEWHFQEFKAFLRRLAYEKPGIADAILSDAFERKTLLVSFTSNFLDGFRDNDRLDLWDKFVGEIIKEKHPMRVAAICFSLNLGEGANVEEKIREEDINILEEITAKSGRFAFLKDLKERNHVLPYALINTLLRTYRRDPLRIERMMVQEIKENSEYLGLFFRQFPVGKWNKWLDWENISPETVEFLKEKLIEISDIDWHEQGLLLDIAQGNLKYILDVFKGRIQKEVDTKENDTIFDRERYDAVPYHFNPELQTFIATHPDYLKEIEKWVEEMSEEWSIYNWNMAEFVQRVRGSFSQVIMSIITKGDDVSLMKATRLMRSIHGGDLELCMQIVGKTEAKNVLNQIDSILYSTGVVMGENGIAEAYEAKARQLKSYLTSENPRIKKYAKRMHESFLESARRERKGTEEEIKLRKLEFEE
jgi:hypothetical protein